MKGGYTRTSALALTNKLRERNAAGLSSRSIARKPVQAHHPTFSRRTVQRAQRGEDLFARQL
ncbi:MAG: hypothetical protein DME18_04120 [Verrucomicrobia bacterium]|nr:MAG: hypothetical protein DME18_04120 [Verrucomicrobiota bacterium]